ncbi:MAG: hypothetical protein IKE45_14715 [Halomonas sp.]|nr:FimV/HubP family polar landmark protein [Halomonas sp.]MBR2515235.1 hypothetical protein [Halomonas sp.]
MKQTHAWLLWLPLSAVSSLALAVGLGPASVNSPLDAPLNATVPVLDANQYALEDLRVAVADEAAFTALGLEWTPLASSLRAQVREQPDGRQVVLSSSQAVDEPWLDVLLTVSSPEGETSQAFTLLFDPPDMLNASRLSASPSEQQAANAAEPRSQPQSTAVPASQNASSDSAPRANNIAYVASGDSLWGIAERVKPASASVQQMMVALVDANPEVFSSGNIDNMRVGQTLAVPSREQIMARTPGEAAQTLQTMRRATERADASSTASQPSAEAAGEEPANSPGTSETAAASETVAQADAEQGVVEASNQEGSQEDELAGLTLNDVVEQLRESQAMLQLVLEEREQLRAELAELRQEVAALTEALNASQREAQAVAALAVTASEVSGEPALGASNARSVADNRGFIERITDYQWPIASVALALLLAGLVWSRKRRERQWEEAPLSTAPSTVTPPTASAGRAEPRMAEAQYTGTHSTESRNPETHAAEPFSAEPSAAEPSLRTSTLNEAPVVKPGTAKPAEPASVDNEAPEEISFEENPRTSSAEDDEALNAAFLDDPQPVDESDVEPVEQYVDEPIEVPSEELEKELEETLAVASPPPAAQPVAQEEDRRSQPIDYYIDYTPPSLKQDEDGEQVAFEGGSAEGVTATPKKANHTTRHTPRVPEEEWGIEEVAFEPRRRDNG